MKVYLCRWFKKSADLLENKLIKALKHTFLLSFLYRLLYDLFHSDSRVTGAEPWVFRAAFKASRSTFRKWLTREMLEERSSTWGEFFEWQELKSKKRWVTYQIAVCAERRRCIQERVSKHCDGGESVKQILSLQLPTVSATSKQVHVDFYNSEPVEVTLILDGCFQTWFDFVTCNTRAIKSLKYLFISQFCVISTEFELVVCRSSGGSGVFAVVIWL